MFLRESHCSIKAYDRSFPCNMHYGLNQGFAHLWVQQVKLCSIVPGHISSVVAMINISNIACITINSLKNYCGILFRIIFIFNPYLDSFIIREIWTMELV